uniref:E3 ubiquitin-protein ligase TRIM39-like n=1 Tax=Xenopus tropicalis TaxID=8364 RepID=F7E7D8_XENTR
MAAADLRDKLTCSLCREIYTDPVTLPCGHNYCRGCIVGTGGEQGERREEPSCPECRQTFTHRPELKKNVTLSKICEGFRSTPPGQGGAGNICPTCDSPVAAGTSCQNCDPSQWGINLPVGSGPAEPAPTDPTNSPRNRTCSAHSQMELEYYCPQDGACVCVACWLVGEHLGHRVEPLSEASENKKEKLREVLEKLSPEREEIKKRIQRLQERRREGAEKAAGETKGVTALFRGIRERLEALEKQMLSEISSEQKKISHQLHGLIRQLEIKKDELSRKIRHIEELCNMADPLTVLQAPEPDGAEFYEAEGGDRKRRKMEDINAPAVGDLDLGGISETLLTGLDQIVTEAKGRFTWQEATDLVLDTETTDGETVSEDRKTVSYTGEYELEPWETDLIWASVILSTRSFSSGRHYWEVKGRGENWGVGVTPRGGYKDWPLIRLCDTYYVSEGNGITALPLRPSCGRIRVSLDYEAGLVSFYELSEPIRHIYTHTDSFTLPLRAAFWVELGSVRITS